MIKSIPNTTLIQQSTKYLTCLNPENAIRSCGFAELAIILMGLIE